MMWRYLTIAGRTVLRNRSYAMLNVAGLAIGLSLAFLIGLWVHDELRTDRFHGHGDRLVRVLHSVPTDNGVQTWRDSPFALAAAAERTVPGVEQAIPTDAWSPTFDIGRGEEATREEGLYADSTFFDVFAFPLVAGDPASVLEAPDGIVIAETVARHHFGPEGVQQAIGQPLAVDGDDATVTGVFADVPRHSSLQFDVVRPLHAYAAQRSGFDYWGNFSTRLYLLLAPEADPAEVEAGLAEAFERNGHPIVTERGGATFTQPVADMHLYGRFENGQDATGRIVYVRLFAIVALVVLVIAAVNFMNLATARADDRAQEIGVRKAVGSGRASLVAQFLAESVLVALIAVGVAALLVALLLPAANALTGKALGDLALRPTTLLAALAVALITGLGAGSYPAMYLSALQPARILRGSERGPDGAAHFRKGLVVFQFALSILLVAGTITVYQQVQYIQTKQLGLDRENVIRVEMTSAMQQQFDALRNELSGRPGIQRITRANQSPLDVTRSTSNPSWPGKGPDEEVVFNNATVGYDFVETMRLHLQAGRSFDRDRAANETEFIVNRTAVRAMGLEAPLGAELSLRGQSGPIVGVVEDFHFSSLHAPIAPLTLSLTPEYADQLNQLLVRAEPGQTQAALASLKSVQQRIAPEAPFDYTFLDAQYAAMHRSEQVVSRLARIFALAAILIACLGLFGLAASSAEKRRQELAIRKVLGASAQALFLRFSTDYMKLVAIAFVVATPLAYRLASEWLSRFAYRIDLGPSVFLGAGALAFAVALAAVSYQAWCVARLEPARVLRSA
jgi:predicted permease